MHDDDVDDYDEMCAMMCVCVGWRLYVSVYFVFVLFVLCFRFLFSFSFFLLFFLEISLEVLFRDVCPTPSSWSSP